MTVTISVFSQVLVMTVQTFEMNLLFGIFDTRSLLVPETALLK